MSTTPGTIRGLPTTGKLGEEPALSVAGAMAFIGALIALLGAFGVIRLTPEQTAAVMNNGPQILGGAVALYALIQGVITRGKVFAPASVARLLAKHKAVPMGG